MPRRFALLLFCVSLFATGCSTGGGQAGPSVSTAESRLSDARARTQTITSFAFRSVTELPGGSALQRTVVEGRAVLPDRVAYSVTVGSTKAEVVQIGAQSYSRTLPGGRWKSESGTSATASPVVVLQAVLDAADAPVDKGDVTFDGRRGRLLEVTLTSEEVRSTGLLDATGGSDVPVTLALDPDGRVLRLAVELTVKGGSTTGALRQVTTYGSFGSVAAVEAPI